MRPDDNPAAVTYRPRTHPFQRTGAAHAPASAPGPDPGPDAETPDLPGCRPIPLRRQDLPAWGGRFEYWDGATGTAWVCDPPGIGHEQPAERLVELFTHIAQARGAPIGCYGTTALERRDERGRREKIFQADKLAYLYPKRARLPEDGGIVVGKHDLPDVLLEVDYTTDVRPWKLGQYESWGFPEVWVEVPGRWSGGRRRGRPPGLTIHVLEGGRYRESRESRAFPGWRAHAIHDALNEVELTEWTYARLKSVGRRLGERDGTGPDDHPFLRSFRDESRAEGKVEGKVEGRAEGRSEGLAEGRTKGRTKTVREMLRLRGIAVSEAFPANVPGFAEAPEEVVAAATLACESEEDFRARIRGG